MSRLRPFQQAIKDKVLAHWAAGKKNVLVKSPTGSGKTVVLADIVRTADCASAVIAHRSELVSQISLALAKEGVRHRIIGPDSLRRACAAIHVASLGRSFYEATARVGVCGVDTLINRDVARDPWFFQVGLWVQDEAHHVLKENKWGAAAQMFPNARGLGVTATPARADGKGLGLHASGLFEEMVEGPEMRQLIDEGFLTDYRVFCPPSDVDYSNVTVTASGDYSAPKLRAAVHASNRIVGDVVGHYLKLARGKLGVTFAVDVESATEIAEAFRAAGTPAEVVSAKTPDLLRVQILKRFANRELLQLVNVDLFGEGFDLPAIEVVSMVRKTESWPLFVQQFGRALRLMVAPEHLMQWGGYSVERRLQLIAESGKPHALIIDHVGNVLRHGLPDAPRVDTLDDRKGGARSTTPQEVPVRVCLNPNGMGPGIPCIFTYERFRKACPMCGFVPVPATRNAPEAVDGDLLELDAETLAMLRGQVLDLHAAPRIPQHLNVIAQAGARKQHLAKVAAQHGLRERIALWAGWQKHQGYTDSESYRRFFHAFGMDVLSAQALGRADAEALDAKISATLNRHGVIAA